MMRTILAGLFVFGCMLGAALLVGEMQSSGPWPWWANVFPICAMIVAIVVALQFFNRKGQRLSESALSPEARLKQLEEAGLVEHRPYTAKRCFAVEEAEDEGPHYYIELVTGGVLYLNGQYLYDYGEITDDLELNQPQSFPCTVFEILRHKKEDYVLSIRCSGAVLLPEVTAPAFSKTDWKTGVPDDGEVITRRSYDALKAERLAGSVTPSPTRRNA